MIARGMRGRSAGFVVRTVSAAAVAAGASGCGYLGALWSWPGGDAGAGDESVAGPRPGTAVRVSPRSGEGVHPRSAGRRPSGRIEVVWAIPDVPVEAFEITWEAEGAPRPEKVRVAAGEVPKFDDPRRGFVYRYVLGPVPGDRSVRVTVASVDDDRVSPPSREIVVPPEGGPVSEASDPEAADDSPAAAGDPSPGGYGPAETHDGV